MMPTVFDSLNREDHDAIRITLTPGIATEMLEANKCNRPIRQQLIDRIANQIRTGRWRFNGDTIKISTTFDVLDGQHRLWAVVMAERPVETLVVFGIDREAFETIDTIRNYRTPSDTVALEGVVRHRVNIAAAICWLIRYERGVLETYKQPKNRVENSDVKEALRANPNVSSAIERVGRLRALVNPGFMGFFYYVLSSQNLALADEMVEVLRDPSKTPLDHPFYHLRAYLASDARKDAVRTTAIMIKAANAAYRAQRPVALDWRSQGRNPERFPTLDVRNVRKTPPPVAREVIR